jgi:hypothetical protein
VSRTAAAVLVLGDIVVLLCRCVVLLNDLESCDFVVLDDLLTVDAPSSSSRRRIQRSTISR